MFTWFHFWDSCLLLLGPGVLHSLPLNSLVLQQGVSMLLHAETVKQIL